MKRHLKLASILALVVTTPAVGQGTGDPEIDAYIEASRRSHVILSQGAFQSTLSFSVGMQGTDFGLGSFGTTQVTASVGLSYGLSRRTEVFVEMPFYWYQTSQTLFDATTTSSTRGGDISLGFRSVLAFESDNRPELLVTAALSHPLQGGSEPNLRLGFDAYRLLDPVLLNFGVGVDLGLESGDTAYELRGGVNFAVSDRFGLGFDVSWTSGEGRFGDPLRDGLAFTASASITSESGTSTFEPFVSIGVSEGATDAVAGVSWARRW